MIQIGLHRRETFDREIWNCVFTIGVLLVPIKSILAEPDFVVTYEYLSIMDSLSIYT